MAKQTQLPQGFRLAAQVLGLAAEATPLASGVGWLSGRDPGAVPPPSDREQIIFEDLVEQHLRTLPDLNKLYVLAVPFLVQLGWQRFADSACRFFTLDDAGLDAALQRAQDDQGAQNSRATILFVTFHPVSLKSVAFTTVAGLDLHGMPPYGPPPYDHLVSFEGAVTLAPSTIAEYINFKGGAYNQAPPHGGVVTRHCVLRQFEDTLAGISHTDSEVADPSLELCGQALGVTGAASLAVECVAYWSSGGLYTAAFGATHWGLGALAGVGIVSGALTVVASIATVPLWYLYNRALRHDSTLPSDPEGAAPSGERARPLAAPQGTPPGGALPEGAPPKGVPPDGSPPGHA